MKEGAILWILNMGVILGVFYWSGGSAETIVYDKYLTRLEAIEFEVTDDITANSFYSSVLDLRKTDSVSNSFYLPDNRTLLLKTSLGASKSHLILRVRNGFERLHAVFSKNIETEKLGALSSIKDKRFVITDPSGNRLTFLAWR